MANHSGKEDKQDQEYDYLFGFGSIINSSTHAPWLEKSDDQKVETLPGAVATLKGSFGYARHWNFRSTTGFTALGLEEISNNNIGDGHNRGVNGVVFRIKRSMIPAFDRREVGYKRVSVSLEFLEFHPVQPETCKEQMDFKQISSQDRIWIYVPLPGLCCHADENHPLLQSYVDTVLQGCLDWGEEAMAEEFVLSTGGWSPFFLNDTPSSRRPWLFRKEYNTIDRLLQKYSDQTHYSERKHPEEFASAMMKLKMKGTWSLPRRNPNFTGRDYELELLQSRLSARVSGTQRVSVQVVEIAGMGGVGKTQLVTEYCYRNFPSVYGLVIWLNAESAEALVSDYRQLLADLVAEGDSNPNKNTEEIIGEVKTRLFRSQVPWLLVFDNVEDKKILANFIPHGAGSKGNVVVTTRHTELGSESSGSLILGCFTATESFELLKRAAGPQNMDGAANEEAARDICDLFAHLPLALGMAAAYMNRCDVTCHEYRDRYRTSEEKGQSLLRHGKLQDYSLSVAASCSLSVAAIEKESTIACEILKLLCFLGPDQITKQLLRQLLSWKQQTQQDMEDTMDREVTHFALSTKLTLLVTSGFLLTTTVVVGASRQNIALISLVSMSLVSAVVVAAAFEVKKEAEPIRLEEPSKRTSSFFSAFEYEQADSCWVILKSFSLLSVKEGKGNMHRLLAQALRASQTKSEASFNLKICINLMFDIWKFNPELKSSWNESLQIVEHVKAVVNHSLAYGLGTNYVVRAALLSIAVGRFSAMALNAFIEAQASMELALRLLDSSKEAKNPTLKKARAEALLELGRVFRYEGQYSDSEESLLKSLQIYEELNSRKGAFSEGVAETLYELGVLEVKMHRLDSAVSFLQKSLDICRTSSTLHQLAAVHVARKPAELEKAKKLLQEALGLSRHIGQRAGTLKQLARVTSRQGQLDKAESYLANSLELYLELYGDDNKLHMNVAAVKFQQGALAFQREQFEQAWLHYNECLRIRRHVYSYARPAGSRDNPSHLEISCVLHERGRVRFAEKNFQAAREELNSERVILDRLVETMVQSERLFQARLNNVTYLLNCAKALDDEDEMAQLTADRAMMKKLRGKPSLERHLEGPSDSLTLQNKAFHCRVNVRRFALQNREGTRTEKEKKEILDSLRNLQLEITKSETCLMKEAATDFTRSILHWIDKPYQESKVPILSACDNLRYVYSFKSK